MLVLPRTQTSSGPQALSSLPVSDLPGCRSGSKSWGGPLNPVSTALASGAWGVSAPQRSRFWLWERFTHGEGVPRLSALLAGVSSAGGLGH